VLGAVDWANLNIAAAFVLGAILATVATLRVVRSITDFFAGTDRQRRRPRRDNEGDG